MSQPQSRIVKLSQREHVLFRPGMYIGSVTEDTLSAWAPKSVDGAVLLETTELTYTPALYKIFDEILVNANDNAVRLSMRPDCKEQVKNIKVEICAVGERGSISVYQDGAGLDTSFQEAHGQHGPQLLFGSLLCGENFDNVVEGPSSESILGGTFGIGSKATNIWSKEFVVETVDAERRKLYTQRWADNMSVVDPPVIKACSRKPYVKVTFTPDWERFGYEGGMTRDVRDLFVKRVYDMCAITSPEVSVHLDGAKLGYKDLETYASLYLGSKRDGRGRAYCRLNDRWEIIAACSDNANESQHVSFVNGIWTSKGGRHVDAISALISRKLAEYANKRRGAAGKGVVKPQFVKDNLFLIIKSTIPDPTFDSQTKENLTTPSGRFGCRLDVPDSFIDRLGKVGILERCDALASSAATKLTSKTDGSKKVRVSVAKLDDANWAGTAKSSECTLFITEGDSAKALAIAGMAVIGRDRYGVWPVRGKPLNTRDCVATKIAANAEVTDLKKILGLEAGKVYRDVSELRYGRVCCLCDADLDGSHIKGLLLNIFSSMWPSLFRIDGFMTVFMTPILKATKGKDVKEFYSNSDFEEWRRGPGDPSRGYAVKHYKGLGSSTAAEGKAYFKAFRTMEYVHDERSDERMSLAFCKKKADERKAWLEQYDMNDVLEVAPPQVGGGRGTPVSHAEFVDRDLKHFSVADIQRSIPNVVDGLKPSQRKIIFGCFKRKLVAGELRVAQLAGYISELGYAHGEASLQGAIVGLAQDFVGSNNINLLEPIGQFGTRLLGGADSASPRYIHTRLSNASALIFRQEDCPILEYVVDEGTQVEPRYYVPIIPVVLCNGALGIGTGFSTNVPCYNPKDVIANVRRLIAGEAPERITPWYRGFTGEITCVESKYFSFGRFARKSAATIEISDLPIGTWTEGYKEFLETQVGSLIKSYDNQCTDTSVGFSLKFGSGAEVDALLALDDSGLPKLYSALKLSSQKGLSVSNIHLFGANGAIRKYADTTSIFHDHYEARLDAYVRRKAYMDAALEAQLVVLNAKARFVREVIAKDILLLGIKNADLEQVLVEREYPKIEDGYGYLTRLPVSSLTAERASALEEDANKMSLDLSDLRATSEQDIWKRELDQLEKCLAV